MRRGVWIRGGGRMRWTAVGVCVSVDALDWSGVFGLCLEFWNLTGKISFASDLKKSGKNKNEGKNKNVVKIKCG